MNDIEINDSFTTGGDSIPELCFLKATKIYGEDKFPFANKDLVGIPLLEGIYNGDYKDLIAKELQEKNAKDILDTLTENGGGEIVITEGTVADIEIPETVTSSTKITAPLAPKTTVETSANKLVYINNTSEEPIDLNLNAPNVSTVYLTGDYDSITANTSIKLTEGEVGTVTLSDDLAKNASVNVVLANDAEVNTQSDKNITLVNSNEDANLNLNTPNSTVTVNGKYNSINSTVGDATLIVGPTTIIKKLVVKKGNVIVNDTEVSNRIEEIINSTNYTVLPRTAEVSDWSSFSGSATKAGITNVMADITSTSGITFGIVSVGNYKWDLGGHIITCGNKSAGCVLVRSALNLSIHNGSFVNNSNNYGIWCSGGTINLYDTNITASTHAVYCEKGEINIYGGEYKLVDEDKTFLVNCYDANYTSGTAKINIYGGKFFGFNPAASMSEQGGPVSFVAEGYESVEVEEGVWEVRKAL